MRAPRLRPAPLPGTWSAADGGRRRATAPRALEAHPEQVRDRRAVLERVADAGRRLRPGADHTPRTVRTARDIERQQVQEDAANRRHTVARGQKPGMAETSAGGSSPSFTSDCAPYTSAAIAFNNRARWTRPARAPPSRRRARAAAAHRATTAASGRRPPRTRRSVTPLLVDRPAMRPSARANQSRPQLARACDGEILPGWPQGALEASTTPHRSGPREPCSRTRATGAGSRGRASPSCGGRSSV